MDAVATDRLGSINLDFAGDSFGAITVDGKPAAARQAGEDIVVEATPAVKAGTAFSVVVPFTSSIFTPAPDDPFPFGWFATADGSVTAFQPNVAYALETQTLSLHAELFFDPRFAPGVTGQRWFYEPIMVHELAHQWYGDSVAPERWSDVWLNEGHATWYEREWEQETGQIDENGFASFEAFMRDQYAKANQYRADFGPVAHPTHNDLFGLFSDNVYGGGALVLYALQQKVGDDAFRAIERAWAQRNRGDSVGTDDFIAFASDVSNQDLTEFLRAWVYGDTVPPMPGHPDWTSDPVTAAAARALSAAPADAVRSLELPQPQGGKTLPRY